MLVVPLRVASNVDVAVIVAVPGATAVTSPEGLTVATAGALLDQVTVVAAPPTAVTVAASCDVVPTMSAASGEVTATDCTAGAGVTVSAADPALDASKVDVAEMLTDPGATAVTTPAGDTVATLALEVAQVTVVDAPPTAATLTDSVRVEPTTRVLDGAETVTEVTDGGGGVTVTSALADLV
jgi:hypothetical protein